MVFTGPEVFGFTRFYCIVYRKNQRLENQLADVITNEDSAWKIRIKSEPDAQGQVFKLVSQHWNFPFFYATKFEQTDSVCGRHDLFLV